MSGANVSPIGRNHQVMQARAKRERGSAKPQATGAAIKDWIDHRVIPNEETIMRNTRKFVAVIATGATAVATMFYKCPRTRAECRRRYPYTAGNTPRVLISQNTLRDQGHVVVTKGPLCSR